MGARAVFRIYSDTHDGGFCAQWGSPQFKLQSIARWAEACRWRGEMPTADNFGHHGEVDTKANPFTERFEVTEPDPGDLDYRYELRSTATLYGWLADLTVWKKQRHYSSAPDEFVVTHRASFSNLNTGPVHELAAAGLRELAETARSLDPCQVPDEAVDFWEKRAAVHEAYAAASRAAQAATEPRRLWAAQNGGATGSR